MEGCSAVHGTRQGGAPFGRVLGQRDVEEAEASKQTVVGCVRQDELGVKWHILGLFPDPCVHAARREGAVRVVNRAPARGIGCAEELLGSIRTLHGRIQEVRLRWPKGTTASQPQAKRSPQAGC